MDKEIRFKREESNDPTIITLSYEDEKIFVDNEEYEYLITISKDLVFTNITDKIMALFTVKKYYDAYKLMESNVVNIDYDKIKHCKHFMINPASQKFYKELYNKDIIDNREYAYYNIISGKLDEKFWDRYFNCNECITFTDVCQLVHETYNGLSNDDIPLIRFGEYEKRIMDEYITPEDKLDVFVYDKPAFLFPIDELYNLIDTNHFNNVNRIFFVISQVLDDFYESEEWKKFWINFFSHATNTNSFSIDNEKVLMSLLYNIHDGTLSRVVNDENLNKLLIELIINSKETPKRINTINNYFRYLNDIDISDYLYDENMSFIVLYELCGFNTNNYIHIKSVTNPSYVIYNRKTNSILFGTNIYDATEFVNLDIWSNYLDDPDYSYHNLSKFEESLYNNFEKDEVAYNEFMFGLCDLVKTIISDREV